MNRGGWNLVQNPCFLRHWWVYGREQAGLGRRTMLALFAAALLGPFAMFLGLGILCGNPRWEGLLQAGWMTATVIWGLFLAFVAGSVGRTFSDDRQVGALPLVALASLPAGQEVLGRWIGSLLPALEGWVLGGCLVPVGVALSIVGPVAAVQLWLLFGVFMLAFSALAFAIATTTGNPTTPLTGAVFSSLLGFLAWPALLSRLAFLYGIVEAIPFPAPRYFHWLALPPLPSLMFLVGEHSVEGLPLVGFGVLVVTWMAFTMACLLVARYFVARGRHLRVEAPQTSKAGQAVLLAPAPSMTYALHARPRSSTRRGLVDWMLRPFWENPYFAAHRSGYMRLRADVTAMPGSAVPPAIVFFTLAAYGLCAKSRAEWAGFVLLGGLAVAAVISGLEGANLGYRALSAEKGQATWPLLLVTGMTPDRVLQGKFASCFYALCGEWTVMLPMWLLACLGAGHPAAILLVAVQPAATVLAVLVGLALATAMSLPRMRGWVVGSFGCLAVMGMVSLAMPRLAPSVPLLQNLSAYSPPLLLLRLASDSTPSGVALGLVGYVAFAGAFVVACGALYWFARLCLRRGMVEA